MINIVYGGEMRDRLGKELKEVDLCVCYNIMRTGSSTSRLVQYVGRIEGFTRIQVVVRCEDCAYSEYVGKALHCFTGNIFKMDSENEK